MSESTFQKISRKTGRKPSDCKCQTCKMQCTTSPCLGTPEDIEKLIAAGYGDRIYDTAWAAGVAMKITDQVIDMYQPLFDVEKKSCTFYENGLCTLHELGLKPTEGKLSHHSVKVDNWKGKKHLTWNVAKEWIDPANADAIARIKNKKTT